MSAPHIPVLGVEAVAQLAVRAGGIYIDATFGAGGYTRLMLEQGAGRVIGIDRDRSAITGGFALVDEAGGRLELVEDRFSNLDAVCEQLGVDAVDGVVMDVGVSSMQIDQAERGFSFMKDGPLDMRMSRAGPSAADLIAVASDRDLAAIISILGEERFARPVARAIVAARGEAPIATTQQLSKVVQRIVHPRPGQIHPATRTFQALRIFINEELNELHDALGAAERVLKPGGRLAVVSFHSLEDRIVKTFFNEASAKGAGSRHRPDVVREEPRFEVLTKRPVVAADDEIAMNPRARSAKLRAAERTAAPARSHEPFEMRGLPSLADAMEGA